MSKFNLILLSIVLLAHCTFHDRKPAQFQSTDEVLVNVGIPLRSIEREVGKLAAGSPIIKRIDFIRMDPETRMLSVKGTVTYPLEQLFNFGVSLPKEAPRDHTFEFAVSFPGARELSQIRYFRLKFHRFRINGDDYMNAFAVVASFIQTVMANSDLIHYVYEQTGTQVKNPDAMTMMREIIESNGFVVNQTTHTIAVKLNLNYFSQFKMYDEIKDLRLWYFGPDLLGGTKNYTVFRLIAGIGKPSDSWVNQHLADTEKDKRTLQEVKESLYRQYSNHEAVAKEINDYFQRLMLSEKMVKEKLPVNYQREIDTFLRDTARQASETLSRKNELFLADPETEYLNFLDNQRSRARSFFTDIDRRLTIDDLILKGADQHNKGFPIVTKRVGQDLLNTAMNFVRDVEVDGQYFVREAQVILAPHIPGMIIKGRLNIDLNYLLGKMNTGFVGKKIDQKASLGDGLPFEMVLETKMGNQGWIGLDPKSIRLFDGDRALSFNRQSSNQQFFLDFIKVYLAQAMAALSIDMTENTQTADEKRAQKIKDLTLYMNSIRQDYGSPSSRSQLEELLRVMLLDVQKNPFGSAGEEFIRKKGQILFSDLISYDPDHRMFRLKLDPRVVLDSIGGVENTLQVWNFSPYVSNTLNNTFLEMSVGNGSRGKRYVEQLFERHRDFDNAGFSGLYNDHDRSAVDILTSVNFHYLENYVNQLFQGMIRLQNKEYEDELKIDKEQSHTLLDNVKVEVLENRRLALQLKATFVTKKKRTLSWFYEDKWKIEKDSYALSAEIDLKSRNLSEIKDRLREDKLPLYFNQEAIGVALNRVKVDFGKPSLINSALSKLTNLNLDTPIGSKFRSLILKIVSVYFNSQYKNSNKDEFYGHEIEEIVKVLTTHEEIILLLNPRLAGPAFELKMAGKEKRLEQSLKVDNTNKELHVAFTASGAMAKFDKRELIDVSREAEELIAPYLRISDAQRLVREMNQNLLIDRLVIASDRSKLSLYSRIIRTMRNYDQVMNLTMTSNRSVNSDKHITSCGVELMYFSSAAYILHQSLNRLIQRINSLKVERQVVQYSALVEARDKLRTQIWLPLGRRYQSHHQRLNAEVLKHPKAYWTYQYYADAFFAERVFSVIQRDL